MFTYFEKSWLKPDSTVQEEYKVKRWQELQGWNDWVDAFYTESINKLEILRTLQIEDQRSLGMTKVGDRREFLTQIQSDFDEHGNSKVLQELFPGKGGKKIAMKPHPPGSDSKKPLQSRSEFGRTLRPTASRDRIESKLANPSPVQQGSMNGVICDICETEQACWHCTQCEEYFCAECDQDMHSEAGFKSHYRSKVSANELDDIRKLGQQSAPMVRVLAQKAAETNTSAILKALGATDDEEEESILLSATPSMRSQSSTPQIPLQNQGLASSDESESQVGDLTPLKFKHSALVTLEEDAVLSTPIRTPRLGSVTFSSPSVPDFSRTPSTSMSRASVGGTRKSIMTPRQTAAAAGGKNMLSPRGSIQASPRMSTMGGPIRQIGSNNRGSLLMHNAGNNSNLMSPGRDIVMTREAQLLITKTKEDAVQASQEADAAGVQVAQAKAKREFELKELEEAELALERKKAIAVIAARRADDSDEARSKAELAQEEVVTAMKALELERVEEQNAAEEERQAMKKVEIAFAKQFHAKTMASQAVQMEHMVARPMRSLNAGHVTVRVQLWLWDAQHRRTDQSQPAVAVEFPYKELVEFKLIEQKRTVEDESDDGLFMLPPSNNGKINLMPVKGAQKVAPTKQAKKPAPRVDKAEAAFDSLKGYVCKRLHASIQHMRATAVPDLVKLSTSLDFGRDPSSTAVDVPSKSVQLNQVLLDNNVSGLVSLPSLNKVKGGKAAVTPSGDFLLSTVETLEWVHPVLGTQMTNFSQIAEVAPTPSQQLHQQRNKPDVYDANESDDATRHAGVSGLPLTYQYKLDATECMQLYNRLKASNDLGSLSSSQFLRKLEEDTVLKRWTEDSCLVIPIDIVFTPPSSGSAPKIPGINSVGTFRFNWAEHCYKNEQQRLLRVCKGCKRYFSDDVNHGSGCRKHNERSTNILELVKPHVHQGDAVKLMPEMGMTNMTLYTCCGNTTCKLKNPPHLAPLSEIKPEQYACDLNGGLIIGDEEEVVSDGDEPIDMDLALDLAEEEEDIVGFSTAPQAVRQRWDQLYPNEAPIGCTPCRHEGNIYLPLRLRTLTVTELRIRRDEAKRQDRLTAIDAKSTSQTHHLQDEVEQLRSQITESVAQLRGGERKVTIAIFEESGDKERISASTGFRQAPLFSFVYTYGLGEEHTAEQWESKVLNPVLAKYKAAYPKTSSRLTNLLSLHCPFTLLHVTDLSLLEALHVTGGVLDLLVCVTQKKPESLSLAKADSNSLCATFAQLRNPVGAVKAGTANEPGTHWSPIEKGECVRVCRICGELFQNTNTLHNEDDVDLVESLLHVGCAKYDLVHPSNSCVFTPFTTNLAYANTVRRVRDKITKLDLQIRKVFQLHDITNNLVKAYDDYAHHNNTYNYHDNNDDDDDDNDTQYIDGSAQDTGDLWSGLYEDDEVDIVDSDIHL